MNGLKLRQICAEPRNGKAAIGCAFNIHRRSSRVSLRTNPASPLHPMGLSASNRSLPPCANGDDSEFADGPSRRGQSGGSVPWRVPLRAERNPSGQPGKDATTPRARPCIRRVRPKQRLAGVALATRDALLVLQRSKFVMGSPPPASVRVRMSPQTPLLASSRRAHPSAE